jgi:hypothetical protein
MILPNAMLANGKMKQLVQNSANGGKGDSHGYLDRVFEVFFEVPVL